MKFMEVTQSQKLEVEEGEQQHPDNLAVINMVEMIVEVIIHQKIKK